MSNLKRNASTNLNLPDKRKKIFLVEDYSQLRHTLTRSIVVEPCRRDYVAQDCWETFLSYEDPAKDIMSAFLILRNEDPSVPEKTSLISELRVYESIVPLINTYIKKTQNQALGIYLMQWGETVSIKEHQSKQIATLYTDGNKNFFKKLGYSDGEAPFLVKSLELENYKSAFEWTDETDLKFSENQYLINNVCNPDVEEDEWLRHFDFEYKLHKS